MKHIFLKDNEIFSFCLGVGSEVNRTTEYKEATRRRIFLCMSTFVRITGICCLGIIFIISLYEFIKDKKEAKNIARFGIIAACCIVAIWSLIIQLNGM